MAVDTIKEVRSWLTPVLVVVTSFLLKAKLSDIEDKIKLIDDVNARVIRNEVKIEGLQSDLNHLDGQLQTHIEIFGTKKEQMNLDELLKESNRKND